MTAKTTTTRQASKASERPPTARKRAPRQSPARCAVPAHREPAGVLSMAEQGFV